MALTPTFSGGERESFRPYFPRERAGVRGVSRSPTSASPKGPPGMPPRFRVVALLGLGFLPGCRTLPVEGMLRTDSKVAGQIQASVDLRTPPAPHSGPMVPVLVRSAPGGP